MCQIDAATVAPSPAKPLDLKLGAKEGKAKPLVALDPANPCL